MFHMCDKFVERYDRFWGKPRTHKGVGFRVFILAQRQLGLVTILAKQVISTR
jgi:hypothetical protein